jgi:hypothetical protein
MKIQLLEKVVHRIQQEIHCPGCQSVFAKRNIEILSLSGSRVNFSSRCHICGTNAQVVAEIHLHQATSSKKSDPVSLPRISKKTVQQLASKLKEFHADDVQKLFDVV